MWASDIRQCGGVFRFVSQGAHRSAVRVILPGVVAALGLILIGQASFIHVKALVAQVLLEKAFAESIATGKPIRPWSWADTWPVARVEVARLGASSIVLNGASGQALAFGPGHVDATPLPGDPGWSVLSAHRDTHFAYLGDVEVGDIVDVTRSDGRRFKFRVTGTRIVRWDQSGIDPNAVGTGLVLSTCWPLTARTQGPLRYLVYAEAVDGLAK